MRSLFQSLQIKLSSSVNLPKIYIWFNSNAVIYFRTNKIPLVWKRFVIHLFFLLFRFRLWRLSFIALIISSHQPLFPLSRRVHLGHLFLQSKTRKYVLWGNFMKHKIFSRDILTFQLSFRRTVVVCKRTLFLSIRCWQNVLTQLWLLKWFIVYDKKNL